MANQEDYYSKWMTPTQQPQTTQQKDYYSKWMKPTQLPTPEPADWKKELPGAIKETWEELPAAEFGKPKYWAGTGKRLGKQALEFK